MGYFQALGVMILILLFVATIIFWLRKFIKSFAPDLKYKIMKPKVDQEQFNKLVAYAEKDVDERRLQMFLLTHNYSVKRSKELLYVYRQILKKLKGGVKK